MTTNPHSIGFDQSLRSAAAMMDKHRIRHLPVLNGNHVIGILTDRDLKFALSMKDVDAESVKVEDICKEEVYIATPNSMLEEVVQNMATKKIGSALIMDNHKLVGIFTSIDALNALVDLLNKREHGSCGH